MAIECIAISKDLVALESAGMVCKVDMNQTHIQLPVKPQNRVHYYAVNSEKIFSNYIGYFMLDMHEIIP